MTVDEFTTVISELERFYQKEMTDEQKKIWFRELKTMKIERLRYIVTQIYRTSKFLPKLADILDVSLNIGYKQNTQSKNELMLKNCVKCNNTGYVIYKNKISNGNESIEYQYGAICDCGRKKQYKGWEISDERFRSNYYTPLVQELGFY